jgi:hypothetical protein
MRNLIIGAILMGLLVAAIAAAYMLITDDTDEAPLITSMSIDYPAGWQGKTLDQNDTLAGLLVDASHTTPDASFLARSIPGRPAEPFDVNVLGGQIEAALGSEIAGFELVSRNVADGGSFEAVQIYYRQDLDGAEYQTLMVVIPTERQTFYLTLRAGASDFPALEGSGREILTSIVNSFDDAGLDQP